MKSSVDEIRERFDQDVERFSNLETGQSATMDAPLALDLISAAVKAVNPNATSLLDIGCGAGNFTLRVLQEISLQQVTLIDLSQPMLDRARERIEADYQVQITTTQQDIRETKLPENEYDVILAAAVLHHLRTEEEWLATFEALYHSLKSGGSLWIFDLVTYSNQAICELMQQRYGQYLTDLQDETYRDHVFEYIAKEDTPIPLVKQINYLQQVGFQTVEVLHVNTCFAAFGAIKG